MNDVIDNLNRVRERIARAAERAGREASQITLVAVTKNVAPEKINQAIAAGVRIIGENRVQEARDKFDAVQPVTWHMIGYLQTNKVKYAVRLFDMIQSVDSLHLALEIEKRCRLADREMPVLVEVNTSGETSKHGCRPEETIGLVRKISEMPHLKLQGLMTIGLLSDDETAVRACFKKLRNLAEDIRRLQIPRVEMTYLSMGMSSDFEWAIEEGSNMVRIGSAIFGPRNY